MSARCSTSDSSVKTRTSCASDWRHEAATDRIRAIDAAILACDKERRAFETRLQQLQADRKRACKEIGVEEREERGHRTHRGTESAATRRGDCAARRRRRGNWRPPSATLLLNVPNHAARRNAPVGHSAERQSGRPRLGGSRSSPSRPRATSSWEKSSAFSILGGPQRSRAALLRSTRGSEHGWNGRSSISSSTCKHAATATRK